jgi:hypothetical protein
MDEATRQMQPARPLADSDGRATSPARRCANCGTILTGRFCAHCGQRAETRLVSVRRLLQEVAADELSLESRLPRTLAALLLRPGRLTAEYAAGRIARYVAPTRLYIVAGLVFFLAVSLAVSFEAMFNPIAPFIDEATGQARDGADVVVVNLPLDAARTPRLLRPLASYYLEQQDRLNQLPPREASRIVYGGMLSSISLVVLLLVPGFALLLKALYRRRLYLQHVIFVLHLHAAFFILALPPLLLPRRWVLLPALAAMTAYLFLALRRVYGQGLLPTAAKCVALVVVYVGAVFGVGLAVLIAAVLTY